MNEDDKSAIEKAVAVAVGTDIGQAIELCRAMRWETPAVDEGYERFVAEDADALIAWMESVPEIGK